MIIVDTREKKNQHIIDYFDKNGIDYEWHVLGTGDYMLSGSDTVTVDRKQNLDELANNLCCGSNRFTREARRAKEANLKLVVLCEHGGGVKTFADVRNWHSKYSKITGRMLQDAIFRVSMAYDVTFLFCDKRQTAKRIVEILEGGRDGLDTN